MAATPGPSQLLAEKVSRFVAGHLGLSFPPERWPDLWRGLGSACPELGFSSVESCAESLLNTPLGQEAAEVLASHLTVGETYFFREQQSFDALEKEILPDLIQARQEHPRPLRLWSAGCATGEEAYSIAMFIHRSFPELLERGLSILATDINPRFLHLAAQGQYTEWSFRGTPGWVKERYFTPCGGRRYQLSADIRRLVTFAYLNLAKDQYPAILNGTNGLDVIFCRNVLMYFNPELAAQVIQKFHRALADDGWLSVSPCDVSYFHGRLFTASPMAGIAFHKKQPPQVSAAAAVLSQPRPSIPPRRLVQAKARPTPKQKPDLHSAARLYEEGRYPEAIKLILEYLQSRPNDIRAITLVARGLANTGQLAEALHWCDQGLSLDPLATSLHLLRGTILLEQGSAAAAVQALKRVLFLRPEHVLAHFGLGNIYHSQGDHAQADRHFGQALEQLKNFDRSEILPDFEGITAGRLKEIIVATLHSETVQ